MGDVTTTLFMKTTTLVTEDAGGLTADIDAKPFWQPSLVVRTDPEELILGSSAALTADGDVWRIMLALPAPMPDHTFYPIALTAAFVNTAVPSTFFEPLALYSIVPPVGVIPLQHAWRSFTMDLQRTVFNGGTNVGIQTSAPDFQGFPPSPVASAETGIAAIGGLQFTVDTFSAGELAMLTLSIDARWLGFPRSIVRSAGFYANRMFIRPN